MRYLRISDCKIVEAAAGGSRALPATEFIREPDTSAVDGHHESLWKVTEDRQIVLKSPEEQLATEGHELQKAIKGEIAAVTQMSFLIGANPVPWRDAEWLASDGTIAILTASIAMNESAMEWADQRAAVHALDQDDVRELLQALVAHRRDTITTGARMVCAIMTIAGDSEKPLAQRLEEIRKVRHSHA